jgi:hypothetical protein
MSDRSAASSIQPEKRLPAPNLPPVEAPTGTFILQLFLIPLIIVTIVILLWLLFSWVAHMGRDNAGELAASIERGDNASWQRAYELADLLRSNEAKYEAVRRDPKLARRLADFLITDLAEPVGSNDQPRIMRRMYLCRALGSFEVTTGIDALLLAAQQERSPMEVEVRYSALEAIATLAHNCGPSSLSSDHKVLTALLDASRTSDGDAPPPPPSDDGKPTLYRPHAELRAVAAYALGVIGGDEASQRLRLLLHDPYPNARYNAATGLARSGDVECIGILKEMLDPTNVAALRDERYANDRARKLTTVLLNGIKATLTLASANPDADLSELKASLQSLADSRLETVLIDRSKVKNAAIEALRLLEDTSPKRKRG